MLAFTGLSMAVARGAPGPAGEMVICTGQGPVMIYLDAEGQPVDAPHLCPDGALSLIQSGVNAPFVMMRVAIAHRVVFPQSADLAQGMAYRIAQARDPPATA